MSDIKFLFVSPSDRAVAMGFLSREAHDYIREWIAEQHVDATFTYDTESALYSGVSYLYELSPQQIMLLKLMS